MKQKVALVVAFTALLSIGLLVHMHTTARNRQRGVSDVSRSLRKSNYVPYSINRRILQDEPVFDCSRILDESSLVEFFWDFPSSDDDEKLRLRTQIVYAGQGWVSWGIPETPLSENMEGSEAIIGLPELSASMSNPGEYRIKGKRLSEIDLRNRTKGSLLHTSLKQTSTHTIMAVTKVLNGDKEDNPVDVFEENLIWAYGFSNTLGFHRDRGAHLIDFSSCPPTTAPKLRVDTPKPTFEPTMESGDAIPTAPPSIMPTELFENEIDVDSKNLVQFAWNTPFVDLNGNILLRFRLRYSGRGWLGWGVPKSPEGDMVISDAVIGQPSKPNSEASRFDGPGNPAKYDLESRSKNGIVRLPYKRQTLKNAVIEQDSEMTVMSCTYILNEPFSNMVNLDKNQTFIWAYGSSNDFDMHKNHGSFQIDLGFEVSPTPSLSPSLSPSQSLTPTISAFVLSDTSNKLSNAPSTSISPTNVTEPALNSSLSPSSLAPTLIGSRTSGTRSISITPTSLARASGAPSPSPSLKSTNGVSLSMTSSQPTVTGKPSVSIPTGPPSSLSSQTFASNEPSMVPL